MPFCVAGARRLAGARDAGAQAITRFVRDTGNINFVTHRRLAAQQDNNGNTCRVDATSTPDTVRRIPARHHDPQRLPVLGWLGRHGADTSVTLNGITVTASRTFAATYNGVHPNYPFFGAFAEVTNLNIVTRQRQLHVRRISRWSPARRTAASARRRRLGADRRSTRAPTERLRAINVYDGLDSVPRQPAHAEPGRLPRPGTQHRRPHRGVHARRRPGELDHA